MNKNGLAALAAEYGLTVLDICVAWGIERRGLEKMFLAHPERVRIVCIGISK
jgi:hypothetical protein